jgi:hypothetical protein
MNTRLFVIRKQGSNQYYACSSEHGCGWNPGHPKQAFSPSELTAQLRVMIDNDWLENVEILQLHLREVQNDQA